MNKSLIEKIFAHMLIALFAVTFALSLVLLGMMLVDILSKHETITLRLDEWKCSDTKQYTTTILVGKVMVPQVHNMCIRYTRR